jgi:AAA domain
MTLELLAAADAVCNAILNAVTDEHDDVVVESPPGAGKTRLLEDATGHAALVLRRRVMVGCPSNGQADDVTGRIAHAFPQLRVDRFIAADADPPTVLCNLPNVSSVTAAKHLSAPVTVATISKYTEIATLGFQPEYLYLDEAFQVRKSEYERIRGLAGQAMLIGDPGQIRPIVKTSLRHFAADPNGPHTAAPKGLLAGNAVRRFGLSLSRRLLQDTVEIVQPVFYTQLAFQGLVAAGQRRLESPVRAVTRTDALLDRCLAAGSLSMIALPPALRPALDLEVIDLAVQLIERLLSRRYRVIDEDGEYEMTPNHIGAVVFHREQVTALRKALGLTLQDVHVETANRFQGLERKITIALHPLSGKHCLTEFAAEAGRMCVAVSRHRVACILIGRDGIRETLDHLVPDGGRFLGQIGDPLFEGWRAHSAFWMALENRNAIIRP